VVDHVVSKKSTSRIHAFITKKYSGGIDERTMMRLTHVVSNHRKISSVGRVVNLLRRNEQRKQIIRISAYHAERKKKKNELMNICKRCNKPLEKIRVHSNGKGFTCIACAKLRVKEYHEKRKSISRS
jgi:uncharacterized protein with PIN domain